MDDSAQIATHDTALEDTAQAEALEEQETPGVTFRPNAGGKGRTYLAFVVMLFGTMLGGLAQTATNTSLTSIMLDFSIPVSLAQWLTNVYTLSLGIVIPLIAFLSRRFTVRQLFISAVSLFLCGSLLACLARNYPMLFLGRCLEAMATGVTIPLMQIVALYYFPMKHRGAVMGIVGLTMGFAPNIGPTIAGALDTAFNWRACYVFLSVFSACILLLAIPFVKWDSRTLDKDAASLDIPSVILCTLGFGSLLLGLSNASSMSFQKPPVWLPLLLGIACLALFTRRELRVDNPLLNLHVFKARQFTIGTIIICMLFGAFIGVSLVIPLHVQQNLGRSAFESGLVLLPGTITAIIASPLSGILMDHIEVRYVMFVSAAILTVATAMLLHLGDETSLRYISTFQCMRTFGITALIMPVTTWSVNALERKLVADGTSVTNALRQVAAAISTTTMVLIMTFGNADGAISNAGVNGALQFSFALCIGILLLILIFVKRSKPTREHRT